VGCLVRSTSLTSHAPPPRPHSPPALPVNMQRMVRDLDFGIKVVGCPIVREADGLAMSRCVGRGGMGGCTMMDAKCWQ
jgi:hypothetical protein